MKKIFTLSVLIICVIGLLSCVDEGASGGGETSGIETTASEHTHSYVDSVIPPSCEEGGYTLHICSVCEDQYKDSFTQALGHDLSESISDAQCNEYQKKVLTCLTCGHSEEEELEVKGTLHSYTSVVTYPDRENGGYTTHSCKNCTSSYVDSRTDPVDFSVGLEYELIGGKYYVSGMGECEDKDVVIPSVTEKGIKVAGIAGNAFMDTKVVSIRVSDGVLDIQSGAFYYCETLTSVTLPKNAVVAENIFGGNPCLTALTLPMNKPLSYYFRYDATAPEGYRLITQGDGTFAGTYHGLIPTSLREVNILNSPVKSSLSGCDMLTKITIPSDAVSIGEFAFRNCAGLTEFSIPETVTSIGGYAFSGTSLVSVTIPEKVRLSANDQGIFAECAQLSEVTLPEKNTIIPSSMFFNCKKLESLAIPDAVTVIGGSAMSGTGIESVSIPDGVSNIAAHTFSGCENLKSVAFGDGIKVIEYGAFENCVSIVEIELPSKLEELGHGAFTGCSSLESVTLPVSLTEIGYEAFKNCTALQYVELPEEIETLESELFFGCVSLREILLPNTVTFIKNSAFEGSGLVSVVIPESVVKVGARVFANCVSLSSVTFSGDENPISSEMFMGCVSLESISVPRNVTEIPERFCKGAESLKSVEFNEGLIAIKDEAFMDCTSLVTVKFPTTFKSIWQRGFKGCSALETVDFSGANMSEEASVNGVEWFADCVSLTEVKNFKWMESANPSIFKNTPIEK